MTDELVERIEARQTNKRAASEALTGLEEARAQHGLAGKQALLVYVDALAGVIAPVVPSTDPIDIRCANNELSNMSEMWPDPDVNWTRHCEA